MKIAEFNEIIEPNDQTEARMEHLEKLREITGNAYPNKYERSRVTHGEDTITNISEFAPVIEIVRQMHDRTPENGKPDQELKASLNEKLKHFGTVRIAGRLAVPPRVMGKAAFVHLSDGVSRLQIYVRRDDVKGIFNGSTTAMSEPSAAADGPTSQSEISADKLQPSAAADGSEVNGWELFKLLDHGDFIGVSGFLFLTNTGELSVHVETLQFLAKALMPMPDKMHGIADAEISRRYRYADLIASSLRIKTDDELEEEKRTGQKKLTTREVFERRAKLISGMRRFLDDHDYIEVETPMLTPKATGAAATPFETHHNALDIPLYARIAPELYLKRLTVGGFEKVYELNRNFRNEGLSHKHNPEFTMLEFYCAYMDVNGMMDFAEAMLKESVYKAIGSYKVKTQQQKGAVLLINTPYRGSLSNPIVNDGVEKPEYLNVYNTEIDFSSFNRLTMKEAIEKECGFAKSLIMEDMKDWLDKNANAKVLNEFLWWVDNDLSNEVMFYDGAGEPVEKLNQDETNKLIEDKWQEISQKYADVVISEAECVKDIVELFEDFVEENLIQPTFITNYPKSISPLSKASPENPQIAERFELFINGMECANGFSELNDPQEQYERFVDQMKERESGDAEAMVLDEDYIRALAYGMPPAAGIGIGIDRLVMLLTNKHSIRDVILFPHMRPERKHEDEPETPPMNPS